MLHKHLRFHRQAREAELWVEVEDKARRPRFWGLRGVSTPLPPQTEIADQSVIHGTFLLFNLWARVLFDSSASHSFIIALCVKELSLEVETLEKPLHVSSPLGTRVRVIRATVG